MKISLIFILLMAACTTEPVEIHDDNAVLHTLLNMGTGTIEIKDCVDLPDSICVWEDGRITLLNLFNMELNETIPDEIGNLTELKQLGLKSNNFNGEIPESIGELTNLTQLSLSNNLLSGSLPESLGNLSILNILDVSNNNLESSIPSTIGNLSELNTFLVNSNNFLGSIPESLCDIGNLDVSNNQFCESQPYCIDTPELMGYQSCECSTNEEVINGYCYSQTDLTILSKIISNADSINMNLDIDSSGIVDPLELGIQKWHSGRLKQLNCYWEAENCNLSGSIPESIGNLTELTNLDLQNNKLTGELPESISNLTNLTNLNISENQLDGSIPDDICTIYSDSTDMDVSNNKFCPPLPDCIDTPDLLGYQECEDCGEGLTQLNGYCYSQIDLDLLQILIVNSNPDSLNITMDADTIAGVQPLELGIQEWRASRIEILDCFWGYEYCNLSSELPTAISNLDSLKYLDLQHNNLRGELPESIGDLTNLTYLNISENQLEGIIPESTCNLSNLQWDSTFSNTASTLFNNQLCPPYPDCDEGPITSEEEQDTSECVE